MSVSFYDEKDFIVCKMKRDGVNLLTHVAGVNNKGEYSTIENIFPNIDKKFIYTLTLNENTISINNHEVIEFDSKLIRVVSFLLSGHQIKQIYIPKITPREINDEM